MTDLPSTTPSGGAESPYGPSAGPYEAAQLGEDATAGGAGAAPAAGRTGDPAPSGVLYSPNVPYGQAFPNASVSPSVSRGHGGAPYAAPGAYPGAYPPPGAGYPGAYYAPYGGHDPHASSKNSWAVASLILSIVGMTILLFTGVCSVLGVIFGHLGLKAAKDGLATNRGMAIGGLIVGYVGLGFTVMFWGIIAIAIIGAASWNDPYLSAFASLPVA